MVSARICLFGVLALCISSVALVHAQQVHAKINHPRPPILQSAADSEEHPAIEPVQTAEKDSRLDPSNFLVVLIAAIILIYSSHRALRPPFMDMSVASEEVAAYNEAAEAGELRFRLSGFTAFGLTANLIGRGNAAAHNLYVCHRFFRIIGAHFLFHVW
jgi:hypothetical protein